MTPTVTTLDLDSTPNSSSVQIPAFCVLSGGGAKAAAFPGCLAAAEEAHIHFQGYAGSSGGAIVAALAASGYRARELQSILQQYDLRTALLEDGGARLATLAPIVNNLRTLVASGRPPGLFSVLKALPQLRQLIAAFGNTLGLYSPDSIRTITDEFRVDAKIDSVFIHMGSMV